MNSDWQQFACLPRCYKTCSLSLYTKWQIKVKLLSAVFIADCWVTSAISGFSQGNLPLANSWTLIRWKSIPILLSVISLRRWTLYLVRRNGRFCRWSFLRAVHVIVPSLVFPCCAAAMQFVSRHWRFGPCEGTRNIWLATSSRCLAWRFNFLAFFGGCGIGWQLILHCSAEGRERDMLSTCNISFFVTLLTSV